MAVSKRVRYEVLRRDGHTCRYCGGTAPDVALTVDHVVPVALGGSDDPSNLVAACRDCNAGKSSAAPDSAMVADVSAKTIEWAAAIQKAADERLACWSEQQELEEWFLGIWKSWTYGGPNRDRYTVDIPDSFGQSLARFVAAGLERHDLEELVDVAMAARTKETWRYFCGCAWHRVRQAQERAKQLVFSDEVEDKGATFTTNYINAEVQEMWGETVRQWHAQFGTRLAPCLCAGGSGSLGEFCGDYSCMVHLCGMAQGFLLGLDEATRQFLVAPEGRESPDGAD